MQPFMPITIQDRPVFEKALSVLSRASCECNFTNVFAWKDVYQSCYVRYGGRVVVLGRSVRYLLFPFGSWLEPDELEALRRQLSQAAGLPLRWGDVPIDYVDAHREALSEFYWITESADDEDYLFKTEALAAVAGRSHQNTRRLMRNFEQAFPEARLRPVTPNDAPAILALATELRHGPNLEDAAAEEVALATAVAHFEALGMEGLCLEDGTKRMLAFSLWSFTTPEVADVHFEKAVRDIDGAAQTIRIGVARALVGRAPWLNLEQDLGVPGLRRSKRSYEPDHQLRRAHLAPLDEVLE